MSNFKISPLRTRIKIKDDIKILYQVEISDFVRALCGSLFFVLPLHYTMEMWARARVLPNWDMALILVAAFFVNAGFCYFTGFKHTNKRKSIWYDALVSLGIGLLASAITMLLIDQISPEIPMAVLLKVIALEAIPASVGASIAKNSLGGRSGKADKLEEQMNPDLRKLLGSFLGAFMIAVTVAATIEPVLIASSVGYWQLTGIALYSLLISFLIVFVADFSNSSSSDEGYLNNKFVETLVSYIVSLVVSGLLLWLFGYLTLDTDIYLALSWITVLGYATTMGGAAGRIIL